MILENNDVLNPSPVQGMQFIYTIYDANVREYSSPMAFESEAALDQFIKLLVRTHSHSRQHTNPEDFAVFRIAEFDPEDGVIMNFSQKQFVNSFSAYALPTCKFCAKADAEARQAAADSGSIDLETGEVLPHDMYYSDPSFKEGDF